MLRYKLLFTFRKNNLEKRNLQLIDNLENVNMLDLMIHQKRRWYYIRPMLTTYYTAKYVYDKWVRI